MSDIDTVLVDSLKALDPKRPIREADIDQVAVTNRDFISTRPIRSGVRGYCPFERRGQGGDIARAAGELTETAPDATTIL